MFGVGLCLGLLFLLWSEPWLVIVPSSTTASITSSCSWRTLVINVSIAAHRIASWMTCSSSCPCTSLNRLLISCSSSPIALLLGWLWRRSIPHVWVLKLLVMWVFSTRLLHKYLVAHHRLIEWLWLLVWLFFLTLMKMVKITDCLVLINRGWAKLGPRVMLKWCHVSKMLIHAVHLTHSCPILICSMRIRPCLRVHILNLISG